jgi:hypothetical protein
MDCKGRVGAGEGNSWWLRQFNGVFRYGFGRLYSKNKMVTLILRN